MLFVDFWNFTIGDLIAIIIAPIGIFGGYYLHKWLRSPFQKIQEENQKSSYDVLFKTVEDFDELFNWFYQNFEGHFKNIKDLEQKFLPLEDCKMIVTTTTFSGHTKKSVTITFEDFKEKNIDWPIDSMKHQIQGFREIIKLKQNLLSDNLSNLLLNYMSITLNYLESFRRGINFNKYLTIRLDYAHSIMKEIKSKKLLKEVSSVEMEKFINKWNAYVASERQNEST